MIHINLIIGVLTMLTKIQQLYPNSILMDHKSSILFSESYLWFCENQNHEVWLGIPFQDIDSKEFALLKSFLVFHESIPKSHKDTGWFEFLFKHGEVPAVSKGHRYRVLQLQFSGKEIDNENTESALKGFFSDDIIIFWENKNRMYIVDKEQKDQLNEEELFSISKTIETDLFINVFLYVGKNSLCSKKLSNVFLKERAFFNYALTLSPQERVFTFEKIFPQILTSHIPEDLHHVLFANIAEIFKDDPDLFVTIKIFLENNMNASMTAKKLYIHRNTLQYRLDKFSERTGIHLKDFNSAVTVFFACLAFEQSTI